MANAKALSLLCLTAMLAAGPGIVPAAVSSDHGRLSVAVAEPDIEAIVIAVGGNQVDTFSLFKECVLKNSLQVESDAVKRLAKADAVVWTGFLKESAAINAGMNKTHAESPGGSGAPAWIDVSKGAARVNIPTTTCFGYIDAGVVPGDPFFWLNPKNGSVIAHNVAKGLANLRPEYREYFLANASAFSRALDLDIGRWKQQLSPLAGLRVFATLCGWQNFSRLGGPRFVVYKETHGSLPKPSILIEQLKRMKTEIVLVDPNTSSEYERAFREEPGFAVADVPSSIEKIPGAKTYSALFENLIRTLLKSAQERRQDSKI